MFVTSSNFDIPPYSIPNLVNVANTFPDYVASVVEEALLKLLGRQLYDSFIEGLSDLPGEWDEETATVINQEYTYGNDIWKALTVTTGVVPVAGVDWELIEQDNKWLELKNGASYQYADKTWKWAGMEKLLTPLVYSRWVEDNVDSFSGNGVVVPSNENSQVISPILRVSRAYNDYAQKVGVIRGYSDPYYLNRSYRWEQCYSYEDTLFGFLSAKGEAVYPDWIFESPGLKNIANI